MVLGYDHRKLFQSDCSNCEHMFYREDVTAHMCRQENGSEQLIPSLVWKNYFRCNRILVNNDIKRNLKKL